MPLMEPLMLGARRSGRARNMALSPEDEESLLRSAARTGLSGLGMVGNLLDLPGSIVRDLGTWLPGGLAPTNPLDQLLSPLSADNRTRGRDLLEGYGMRSNRETGLSGWMSDPGEGLRDVAGFSAEVLLDPLTYLTGGASAFGKGGRAVKAAGLGDDVARVAARRANLPLGAMGPREAGMTTTVGDMLAQASPEALVKVGDFTRKAGYDIAEHLDEPMRATARAKVPFMDPVGLIGTGPTAQKVAKFLDKYSPNPFELGSAIKESPIGLAVGSLMDATRYGKLTKEATPYAQQAFRATTGGLSDSKGVASEAAGMLSKAGMTDTNSAKIVRQAMEGIPGVRDPSGAATLLTDRNTENLRRLLEEGYGARELDDVVGYSSRFSASPGKGTPKPPTSGISSADKARYDLFKGNRQGTVGTENVLTDPVAHAEMQRATDMMKLDPRFTRSDALDALAANIRSRHGANIIEDMHARNAAGDYLFEGGAKVSAKDIHREGRWSSANEWQRLDASGNVTETLTAKTASRTRALADYMLDHPEIREKGLFTNHPVADFYRADQIVQQKLANASAVRGLVSAYAKPAGSFGDEGVKVGQLMRDVGLVGDNAMTRLVDQIAPELPSSGDNMLDMLRTAHRSDITQNIRSWEIPKHIADDWRREVPRWEMPESLQPFQKAIDSMTNLFKAGVLTRPARYVRDLLSGQARNVEAGMWDSASAFGSHALLHGDDITGAADIPAVAKWLTARGKAHNDKNGTDALRQLYATHGPGSAIEQTDVAGRIALDYTHGLDPLLELTRGRTQSTIGKNVADVFQTAIGNTAKTTRNPLDIRGVGARTETKFGPVAAGERIGMYTDDMNRLVPFVNQLKKGVDPAEAMRRINEAQVSYDPRTFTPTEQVLKRLFPFYSFTSRQLKYAGKTLTERPGAGMGQTIRAINSGRDQDAMLPEHIADTAAIPLEPRVDDGTKRYLTGLGLMLEDPLSMLGGPRAAGLETLSRMNPLVKGPLEWATGTTFFQKGPKGGRPLDDLDPTVGRILANISGQKDAVRTPQWMEAILGNSPASAFLTAIRQGTDTRKNLADKAVALTTGVRVADVSPAAQDAMLREWVQDAEKKVGGKTFTKSYIPDKVKAEMTPIERAQALQLEALMAAINQRTKKRKANSK